MKKIKIILLLLTIFVLTTNASTCWGNDSVIKATNGITNNIIPIVKNCTDTPVKVPKFFYLIGLGLLLILKYLPFLKKVNDFCEKSNNLLLQRWASYTSSFMNNAYIYSTALVGIISVILQYNILPQYENYLTLFNTALIGISGLSIFSTANKRIIDGKKYSDNIDISSPSSANTNQN